MLHQRTVDQVDELVQPVDGLPGHAESDEIVDGARLEVVDLVTSRQLGDLADTFACRDQVPSAGVEPGSRAFAGEVRRRDRALARVIRTLESDRRSATFAEQEVPLGDSDVGPDQRRVLTDQRGHLGDGTEASNRLVGATRVPGDLCEHHLEPHPGAHGIGRPGAVARRLQQCPCLPEPPRVAEGMSFVDEVQGDAATGQPSRKVGLECGTLPRELSGLVAYARARPGSTHAPR